MNTRRDLVAAAEDLRYAVLSLHTGIVQDVSDFVADPEDLYFAPLNQDRGLRRNSGANDAAARIETG